MSRIYEALQKAEAERGNEQGSESQDRNPVRNPDRGPERTPARGIDREFNRVTVERHDDTVVPFPDTFGHTSYAATADPEFDAFDPTDVFSHSAAPSFAPDALPTRVPGVDLEAIPQLTWTPSFERLPAVLERGPGVEQFRSLRSRIYELRDKRPLKTILVTSGLPQEGKSFVSTNLAVSLARNKAARVLLIDGDMRRYTVHQILGCNSEPGLADYLSGRATLPEVLQRCDPANSRGTLDGTAAHLPPLTLIAGGNGGDKAADLSNNNRFEELITTLSPLFDWIIVDSSPVLPVSDAVNLSRSSDGVLLVTRSGVTEYENAQRTQAELKNAHLLGVVLNGTPTVSTRGYYGYSAVPAQKIAE